MFQSLDWVDVDFDPAASLPGKPDSSRFNPSTGLMLISTRWQLWRIDGKAQFQSLDWVDVDFDTGVT